MYDPREWCVIVSHFSVCNDTHRVINLTHHHYTSDTLPTNLLTHHFLKRMHNVQKKSIAPCIYTMQSKQRNVEQNCIGFNLVEVRERPPGTLSRAFPNALNFPTSNREERARLNIYDRVRIGGCG